MDKIQALQVFINVAKANSFNIAADRLDLSAPMVSRNIAWLEKSIGARLFNRTTRHISLTEAGVDYYQRAVHILDAIDEADAIVAQGDSVRGTLRVTVPTSFGQNQLMPIVSQFMQKHPNINVELNLENRQINLVEEGYDLAIRITRILEPGHIARKLCDCKTLLCASPDYIKKHGMPKSIEDISQHTCVLFPGFQRQTWQFVANKKIEEIEVNGRLQINNVDAIVEAVVAGMGIAHFPTFLIGDLVREKKLQIITLNKYSFNSPGIYLVYANKQFLPPKIREFISTLTEWASPIPPWDRELFK